MCPNTVVCIATFCGFNGPGIEPQWGAKFSAPIQTVPGTHPVSCILGTEHCGFRSVLHMKGRLSGRIWTKARFGVQLRHYTLRALLLQIITIIEYAHKGLKSTNFYMFQCLRAFILWISWRWLLVTEHVWILYVMYYFNRFMRNCWAL